MLNKYINFHKLVVTKAFKCSEKTCHLASLSKRCFHLSLRVVKPMSLCTLVIKPDMSYSEVTKKTTIVGADTSSRSVTEALRQAGFTVFIYSYLYKKKLKHLTYKQAQESVATAMNLFGTVTYC